MPGNARVCSKLRSVIVTIDNADNRFFAAGVTVAFDE